MFHSFFIRCRTNEQPFGHRWLFHIAFNINIILYNIFIIHSFVYRFDDDSFQIFKTNFQCYGIRFVCEWHLNVFEIFPKDRKKNFMHPSLRINQYIFRMKDEALNA